MCCIFKGLTAGKANEYGLVLDSSGIPYHVRKGENGWDMYVHDSVCDKALNAIEEYVKENQAPHPEQEACSSQYEKTFSGIWVSFILLAFHAVIAIHHDNQAVIRTYGSAAQQILHGELYRTVTSLMIHANVLHLLGNMFCIALFGTAVCRIMGPGVGWLIILLSGICGNLMNALLYQRNHLSVGSSTAIFGAIGVLAGYRFLREYRHPGGRARAWLPLGGGLALLAFLGGAKHSDLTAHAFGFLSGIIIGVIYCFFVNRPAGRQYQICFLLFTLSIIVTSWFRGFGA
ncbi:MAG: hypothetical protein BA861_08995 [Desulfobacterales bacterium S3730MH5]|nr:MAG: hypothetical protein BA861_08995 [Desulfobacterales bacterium S3730MH5]